MVQPGVSALGKKKRMTGLPRKSLRLTASSSWLATANSGTLSPISMKPDSSKISSGYLYRNRAFTVFSALVIAMLICLSPRAAHAQSKKNAGPRAIGVVTWNGDNAVPTPTTSVLTPVAIRVEGRYYDAELYQSQPAPLAVDSGVVYDVLKSGDVIGTFTVGSARERNDVWYGIGAFEKKGSKEQAAKAAPAKPAAPAPPADDRPRLRRGAPPPPAPKEQTDAVLNSIEDRKSVV